MPAVGVGDGFEVVAGADDADAAGAALVGSPPGAALVGSPPGVGVGAVLPVSVVPPAELAPGSAPWLVPPLAPDPALPLPLPLPVPVPFPLPVPVPVPPAAWPSG